ncbi:hypothetical protein [Streptomyces sp. NPDC059786]|uniref:hypothetical protein n=1 Tax=Streptomyces sp. NPDC059786 TaxID=3346946 RepID=UPI003667C709
MRMRTMVAAAVLSAGFVLGGSASALAHGGDGPGDDDRGACGIFAGAGHGHANYGEGCMWDKSHREGYDDGRWDGDDGRHDGDDGRWEGNDGRHEGDDGRWEGNDGRHEGDDGRHEGDGHDDEGGPGFDGRH